MQSCRYALSKSDKLFRTNECSRKSCSGVIKCHDQTAVVCLSPACRDVTVRVPAQAPVSRGCLQPPFPQGQSVERWIQIITEANVLRQWLPPYRLGGFDSLLLLVCLSSFFPKWWLPCRPVVVQNSSFIINITVAAQGVIWAAGWGAAFLKWLQSSQLNFAKPLLTL